ncbi:MAG: polymorphic toxin type 44 domain-containing protein [Clostridia bacterium]|nr:polymorphic toxin type 44 domain-containing protein [Clostridia bacterium]
MSLYSFCSLAGSSPSGCSKCKSFLELSESSTKRLSRASESDIDKAVNVMYNGGKVNICSWDRLRLIEKAYSSGIIWTAGNDLKKLSYIKEVMGNHDQKFLGDVYHKYIYKRKNSEKLIGTNRRDIFSDDYIKEYEKRIFGTELSWFMSNFDYLGFYKEKLKYVIKKMITDIGSKINKQCFWIRAENAKRMKDAAASIEKCGISSANLYDVLKNFELTDVTDKLMKILREAKRDGKSLKAKYPNAFSNPARCQFKYSVFLSTSVGLKQISDTISLLYEFANLVGDGCKYDIKRKSGWQYDLQYYFDGMILDYDDPGNIVYGVIAKAAGISEFVSHAGAGAVNLYDAIYTKEYKKILSQAFKSGDMPENDTAEKAFLKELTFFKTDFDDKRDYQAIELGFRYYYKV